MQAMGLLGSALRVIQRLLSLPLLMPPYDGIAQVFGTAFSSRFSFFTVLTRRFLIPQKHSILDPWMVPFRRLELVGEGGLRHRLGSTSCIRLCIIS